MSEAKRYWTAELWDHEETKDAQVVLATDFETLETRYATLEAENSVLIMDLESCEEGGGEGNRILRTRIAELETRCAEKEEEYRVCMAAIAELQAENAKLRTQALRWAAKARLCEADNAELKADYALLTKKTADEIAALEDTRE